MTSPKIFIILPVYNRVQTTLQFVVCLKKQTVNNYSLIIVDDGSTDGTAQKITELMDDIVILNGDGNLWWGGSLQKAIDYLKKSDNLIKPDDVILVANDDTAFDVDFFEKAINILNTSDRTLLLPKWKIDDSDILVETGVVYNPKNFTFRYAYEGEEINLFTTMCLFMRWSDMLEIGNFHPVMLPHYNSDSEYTYRAYRKGFKLITRNDFWIIPDRTKTGYHKREFRTMLFGKFIKVYFSRKSSSNPFCKVSMIILTSPLLYVLPNITRVLLTVIKDGYIALVNSVIIKSGLR